MPQVAHLQNEHPRRLRIGIDERAFSMKFSHRTSPAKDSSVVRQMMLANITASFEHIVWLHMQATCI